MTRDETQALLERLKGELQTAESANMVGAGIAYVSAADLSAAIGLIEKQADDWISVKDQYPPRHENVLCHNRDGRIFEGRICAGMHTPFFTIPHGDGNASNTAPSWIDVTHWRPKPKSPPSALEALHGETE